LGKRLLEGLQSLTEFPFVGDVRGLGLVCGVEIVSDKSTKAADPATTMKIFKAAEANGLRSRPLGNTLAFSPPLSSTKKRWTKSSNASAPRWMG
jgi:adenosylmethionine-8-amino-7-oxononanoate aminotransferase